MIQILGLAVAGLALVLNIVGLAIPYWFYASVSVKGVSVVVYCGLWTACVKETNELISSTTCRGIDEAAKAAGKYIPSEFYVARGLEITAVLVLTCALALACLKVFVRKENKQFIAIAGGVIVVAGILMIVGAVVFETSDYVRAVISDIPLDPHAGFALCIVSGVLSFVAAVAFIVEALKSRRYGQFE